MESLKLSFDAVMPIFILMALGYLIKRLNLCDKKSFDAMNKLVFKIFLPTLLFYNIYKAESATVIDVKLMSFTVITVLAITIIGYFCTIWTTKDNSRRAIVWQSMFRANYAILGIPLVTYICGENSGALTSFMAVIIVPLFNILAVISLSRFGSKNEKINIPSILKGIITNPLIIGSTIGLIFFFFKLELPVVLEKSVKNISSVATPLALIALGSEFVFTDIKGYVKEIIVSVSARLIVVPLIGLSLAILMGFRGEALACLMIAFGSPLSVSSFAMSQQMGADEKLCAQTIVISSAFCLVTLFLWIFLLSYLKLF
ncbi:MAG: AEC family transporter [Clostridia bacterium]|nr:AEC family transporter [Clostridia bacterium]